MSLASLKFTALSHREITDRPRTPICELQVFDFRKSRQEVGLMLRWIADHLT